MSVSKHLIKLMRKERGWSQEQLAVISGISERTVQRIEKRGKCSLDSKMALASAFEVSPSDLEDSAQSDVVFEQQRIDWISAIGYIIFLIILPILLYLLTNTHGIWEIGCLLIVDGLTIALSTVSHGAEETIRFFSNTFAPVKKTARVESYKVHIVHAKQVIQYAYTIGFVSSVVYILVILTQSPDKLQHTNVVVVEAAIPIFYAILIIELWIRPYKHKMENRLADASVISGSLSNENDE